MSGSSAYPGAVDTDQSNVDNVDLVLAADVNDAQKSANQAQIYLGQDPMNITDALAGSPLTAPNVVGGYTGATGGSNAARLNPQVGALSTIATLLRRITGNASWLTSPLASIASILGFKFVTAETVASLTGSVNISGVIGVGALGSMPAAAAGNNGWLYLVTSGGTASQPNNTLYRSNGSAWVIASASVYTAGSFAAGDLAYYDATNHRWTRLAIGSSGQFLRVTGGVPAWVTGTAAMVGAVAEPAGLTAGDTVYWDGAAWQKLGLGSTNKVLGSSGSVPVWTAIPNGTEITLPAVFQSSIGAWAQYSTIQAAINAANSITADYSSGDLDYPDFVVVPPGTYIEDLTLKAYVPVVELVPNTVTIAGAVTMGANTTLKVFCLRNSPTLPDDPATLLTITCASASDVAIADIGIIRIENIDAPATPDRIGIQVTQGTAHVRVRAWRVGTFNTSAAVFLVDGVGGTLHLINEATVRIDAGATWDSFFQMYCHGATMNIYGGALADAGTWNLIRSSGSLNVYGVQYNRRLVAGTVNQSIGDRASSHYASAAFFNSAI